MPANRPGAVPVRLLVLHNPTAGTRHRRRFDAVADRLKAAGAALDLRRTGGPGDAERLTRQADMAGYDRIVAAGGDGTVNEVVAGLIGRAGAPPLALLPLGTANALAAEIGLDPRPGAVARAILSGPARGVAIGRANDRPFVQVASVGFDAWAVATLNGALKRRLGKGAYVWAALKLVFRFPFADYDVTVDGVAYRARSVVVANGRCYGGGAVIAPAADLGRASFQVCLFENVGALNIGLHAAALFSGRLHRLGGVRIVTGRDIRISSDAAEPVQGDGDVIARLPVEITIADRRLDLVYPP